MNLCTRISPGSLRATVVGCVLSAAAINAQTVFVAPEVRITATSGTVKAATPQGGKITVTQVPRPNGEVALSAIQQAGSTLETGADSHAFIAVPPAGSLMMGPDTQVRLPAAGEKGHSLELLRGQLFMNISAEELKKKGDTNFRLKTPAALLGVKGTRFFAISEKDIETSGVNQGTVAAYATAAWSLLELQAGNAVSITKGKVGQISPLTAEERGYDILYDLAASEGRLVNSLGMKFALVPGTRVLFCIHETRNKDYQAYLKTQKTAEAQGWQVQPYGGYAIPSGQEDHPATNMIPDSAKKFCAWLSQKEGRNYRLPTDEEWSFAVGIGRKEVRNAGTKPLDLDGKIPDAFPWGTGWPPPPRAGNYCDESYHKQLRPQDAYLERYDDGFPTTAPVMSFSPNSFGLFDLGGNAWEWVDEDDAAVGMVLRGGSFLHSAREFLLSSKRLSGAYGGEPDKSFRVVLALP